MTLCCHKGRPIDRIHFCQELLFGPGINHGLIFDALHSREIGGLD